MAKNAMNKYLKALIRAGSVAAAIGAILTTWHLLGWDTLAWSSDVQRLNRQQAIHAVELYNDRIRSLLSAAPQDTAARLQWDEELRRARIQLDEAQRRSIELSR